MGCFVLLFAFLSPRLALAVVWVFTGDVDRAFDSFLVPLLGFFLLPWTTLAYAVLWSTGSRGIHGLEIFIVVFAFLADIGSYAGGERTRARN